MTGKNWERKFLDLCEREYRRFCAVNGREDRHMKFSFVGAAALPLWGLFKESGTIGFLYPMHYGKTKREIAEEYTDDMLSSNGVKSVEELELLLESEGM